MTVNGGWALIDLRAKSIDERKPPDNVTAEAWAQRPLMKEKFKSLKDAVQAVVNSRKGSTVCRSDAVKA